MARVTSAACVLATAGLGMMIGETRAWGGAMMQPAAPSSMTTMSSSSSSSSAPVGKAANDDDDDANDDGREGGGELSTEALDDGANRENTHDEEGAFEMMRANEMMASTASSRPTSGDF